MTIQEWLGKDNQLGIDIWEKKYRFENENFDEWLNRITDNNEEYKQLILDKKFLPAGRILANRGLAKKGVKVTYSNCYVIPAPEDNIESIFDCAKAMARTFSYGGGVGIDISKLAPKGARVNNAAKQTSGSVSFMDLYSLSTELIGQNGRRGALMISMVCDHPDIEDFIEIKSDLSKVTKANISVRVTKDFMDAVINDKPFKLSFKREESGEIIEKVVNAHKIFSKLAYMNWDYAEPGILFWDRIREWNLLSNSSNFKYAGVNPCAEEPLPAGGSCLLGSINLAEFVSSDSRFNMTDFKRAVRTSVRYLNDILDEGLRLHPLPIQQQTVADWRQIGLGIMGLADALIKCHIKYGSPEALDFSDELGYAMIETAIDESALIAKEKGPYAKCTAKILETEFFNYNVNNKDVIEHVKQYGLRNSQLLTCAPTGTLSTMLGISGGIEPIFANYYTRKTQSLHGHDEVYKVYTPIVHEYMTAHNITDDTKLPDYFITAPELNPLNRIKMQSVWQSHIDASISSTINLDNNVTQNEVEDIYLNAYKAGLKGLTIYRAGCKREGILTTDTTQKKEEKAQKSEYHNPNFLERGEIIHIEDTDAIGLKRKLTTGCGSLHCAAFFDINTGNLVETYLSKGSTGGCNNFMISLSRMISTAARGGVSIDDIIDQLMSTGVCPSYATRTATKHDTSPGSCCPMAVGKALKEMWEEFNGKQPAAKKNDNKTKDDKKGAICPECGAVMLHEGGCDICKECGYSHCG